jgi:hypothetical protein
MRVSMEIMEANGVGGVPAHGNQRSLWDAGYRFDHPNPEHRQRRR